MKLNKKFNFIRFRTALSVTVYNNL